MSGSLEVLLAFGIASVVLFTGGFFAAGMVWSYTLVSSSYLGLSFSGGELDFVSLGLTSRVVFYSNITCSLTFLMESSFFCSF